MNPGFNSTTDSICESRKDNIMNQDLMDLTGGGCSDSNPLSIVGSYTGGNGKNNRPSPPLSLDGLDFGRSLDLGCTSNVGTPEPVNSGINFRAMSGCSSVGYGSSASTGVSPEPGVIGQQRHHHANNSFNNLTPYSNSPVTRGRIISSPMPNIPTNGQPGGELNTMVSEISTNLRRLADMIERNGVPANMSLPSSNNASPSPLFGDLIPPALGQNITMDPIVLRNLEMLARVAESSTGGPAAAVVDRMASAHQSSIVHTPTPPASAPITPTPASGYTARQGKVNIMQIRCKFGQLGSGKGQFSSPHGFCLGLDEEIVIADTNNHRICIYDKQGEFKTSFGVAGKDEGQLWYPRKVAFIRGNPTSNTMSQPRFVICDRGSERSRMQIFTRNGHFVRKIAIRYIDIVAGLAITPSGHIVAVDSVSPTVFVISETGDLLRWFDCSEHMREPSDVAVANNEFYICDFKGHCVVVFSEDGQYLRRIGYENLTNFPNGIDISDAGDVLIGDSHGNRFHVVVFDKTGSLLGEFECPYVKVSRCCGLKITSEGYIVTLAKNNHHVLVLNTLYIV